MTDKKCPKCKSKNFEIHDTYAITGEETWDYIVEDGIVIGNGSRIDYRSLEKSAKSIKIICACSKCGHRWRPRNFNYTEDLPF